MMPDDDLSPLTDDEKVTLIALLKRAIDDDRYPLSPRIGMLRGILAKLEPPRPAPAPLPPLKANRSRLFTGGGAEGVSVSPFFSATALRPLPAIEIKSAQT